MFLYADSPTIVIVNSYSDLIIVFINLAVSLNYYDSEGLTRFPCVVINDIDGVGYRGDTITKRYRSSECLEIRS